MNSYITSLFHIADSTENQLKWFESEEICPKKVLVKKLDVNSRLCGQFDVKFVSNKDAVSVITNTKDKSTNSVLSAEQNHSDLISAVYEGCLY